MDTEDSASPAASAAGADMAPPGAAPDPPPGCACSSSSGQPPSAAERAALVTEYLRQALPPVPSAVLVLPSFAPSGQMVLGCDARLPAVPYGEPSVCP